MTVLTVQHTSTASPTDVWAVLSDFGGIAKFHPLIETSPLIGEQTTGLGAQRTCNFYDGNHVVEQVSEWVEGESMTIQILEGSMPLTDASAQIQIAPTSSGTLVTFTMNYTPKFGPLGAVMNALMMKRQFTKVLGNLLAGLDVHTRTGEIIGKEFTAARAA